MPMCVFQYVCASACVFKCLGMPVGLCVCLYVCVPLSVCVCGVLQLLVRLPKNEDTCWEGIIVLLYYTRRGYYVPTHLSVLHLPRDFAVHRNAYISHRLHSTQNTCT